MTQEINSAGYADIRQHVIDAWKELKIVDASNAEIITLAPADSRLTWTVSSGQTLEVTGIVRGNDPDIVAKGLPITFAGSQIQRSADHVAMGPIETFTQFVMADPSDTITIKHSVQVPKVV